MSKILVVGAGFSGAVIARELAEAGHNVTVIDSRMHIAGNAYDYVNEHGIRIHKYGPHLFHTRNKQVYDYLGKFTTWIPYKHKVKALLSNGEYKIDFIIGSILGTFSIVRLAEPRLENLPRLW